MADYRTTVLAEAGLISYWGLGEASGTFNDLKDGNGGVDTGTVTRNQSKLALTSPDNAISLSGANYVNVADATNLKPSTAWTMEAWIKPTDTTNLKFAVRKGDNYFMTLNAGQLEIGYAGATSAHTIIAGTISINTTYYVVGTWDGTTVRAYINGAEVGNVAASETPLITTDTFRIGISKDGTNGFLGVIDEVSFYNVALSAGTIQAHYDSAGASPIITYGSVTQLTGNTATLNANINPQGLTTTYHWERGTTTAYGTSTPETPLNFQDTNNHAVTLTVTGLSPGTTYHYRLVATGTPQQILTVPSTPTGLTGVAGDTNVALNWNTNPSGEQVDSYQVYQNSTKIVDNLTSTTYTRTGLTNGTAYNFQVSAHNAAGYGGLTSNVSVTPTASGGGGGGSGTYHRPYIFKYMLQSVSWSIPSFASKWDVVIIQCWNTQFISPLRAANPNMKILAYQDSTLSNTSSNGGLDCPTMVSTQTAQSKGYLTGFVNSYGLSQDDIRKSGYVTDAIAGSHLHLDGRNFDGIFLDDFNADSYWQPSLAGTAWESALHTLGQQASANWRITIANMDGTWGQHPLQDNYIADVNFGGFDEFFITWPGAGIQGQSVVNSAFNSVNKCNQQGKNYLAQTIIRSTTDTQYALAGYCAAICAGATHYSASPGNNYGPETIYIPEFDIDIGTPVGPYTVSGTTYTRQFTKKKVTFNLGNMTGSIV